MKTLGQLSNLQSLIVNGQHFCRCSEQLSKFSHLTGLRKLILPKHKIRYDDLIYVRPLTKITKLELGTTPINCLQKIVELLPKLSDLSFINANTRLRDEFKYLIKLDTLHIYFDYEFSDEDMKVVGQLTNLKRFIISGVGNAQTTKHGVQHLVSLTNLQELSGFFGGNEDSQIVGQITSLRTLRLSLSEIDDNVLRAFSSLHLLTQLSIYSKDDYEFEEEINPYVTDEGLNYLMRLTNLKALRLKGVKLPHQLCSINEW
eukprot:TRINITY_DN1291_c0_g1_i1.p1 TRINITY_DN1291_c0_g1~~TRINITY_DN1291_c0_g1_i1.p1  ORF type:complete len:259 (+),score=13.44 TRINITY_DN1291_c0_g1_i1:33-809(+)